MSSWDIISYSPDQTRQLGELVGRACGETLALLLEGDLGSGKTSFVQGVARGLDVPPEVPVNSPTYTLMNQYQGRTAVFHFDLYRLGSSDELIELDFDSYLFGQGVTIVEWAGLVERQNVQGVLVELVYGEGEDVRELKFSALGPEGEQVLQTVAAEWKEA